MDRREPLESTDGGEARKSIGFGAIHAGSLGLEGAGMLMRMQPSNR